MKSYTRASARNGRVVPAFDKLNDRAQGGCGSHTQQSGGDEDGEIEGSHIV